MSVPALRGLAIALAAALLAGCAQNAVQGSRPGHSVGTTAGESRIAILSPTSIGVPYRDEQQRFRSVFCAVLASHVSTGLASGHCEDYLPLVADTPDTPETVAIPAPKALLITAGAIDRPVRRLRVVYVLGLASDCADQPALLEREMRPFVESLGHGFGLIRNPSLASSVANAKALNDVLMAEAAVDPIVLIAHSKGTVDALHLLVEHPEVRDRIVALVSLAGAVGGSPLADIAPQALPRMTAALPFLNCGRGDLGAIESLRPAERQAWLDNVTLPTDILMYSLVTMPTLLRMAPGLIPAYRLLRRFDPLNDGNLLARDQIIPGSRLLGFLDADHWAVGSDLQSSPSAIVRAAAGDQQFPRRALIEAVLRVIENDLNEIQGSR